MEVKKMNARNDEYIVLFGNDRYHPDLHVRACRHKFDYIKDAREYAKEYENAYIFKCHYFKDSGDLAYITDCR